MLVTLMSGCASANSAVPVRIVGEPGEFVLLRGGAPYEIKGVGLGVEADAEALMSLLAESGGNSFRTWHVIDRKYLDMAHRYGLTVALCLDMARERHGFDYGDRAAVARQLEEFRRQVQSVKDHPALLFWIIGNELNHESTDPRVWDAVDEVSRMIHEIDPAHPTTTATAGADRALFELIAERAPDLDFLSVQLYGGLPGLTAAIDGVTKPVMVTEWGTVGHWEVDETSWGAPLELTSREKAANYLSGYQDVIAPLAGRVVGNYAFLWAQKQERTPTWYGMFTASGEETEVVDAMRFLWRGRWPDERAPSLLGLSIEGDEIDGDLVLDARREYRALARATGDGALSYRWEVRRESRATQTGGDPERVPPVLSGIVENTALQTTTLRTPNEEGAYRLFVYVTDNAGKVAHANLPFFVKH